MGSPFRRFVAACTLGATASQRALAQLCAAMIGAITNNPLGAAAACHAAQAAAQRPGALKFLLYRQLPT